MCCCGVEVPPHMLMARVRFMWYRLGCNPVDERCSPLVAWGTNKDNIRRQEDADATRNPVAV
jgi:hypothetical protein